MVSRAFLSLSGLLAALPVCAQYVGQVTKTAKEAPELRAVAVLEWTGEAGKPKTCRIVPVAILDGGELQDGGIYLSRPEPLAIRGEVEYELQQNGSPVGLFDIENTGREQGSWVGYGKWKPMPVAKPEDAEAAKPKIEDEFDDQPTLHRKKHPEDATGGKPEDAPKNDSAGNSAPAASKPDDDPDRPHLHKKDSAEDAGSASQSGSENNSAGVAPPADDPDRPVLKKEKKKQAEDESRVSSLPGVTDPNRPRLKRGKSNADSLQVAPSLMGLPHDMQQAVAVSDAKAHPQHPWSYVWVDHATEDKFKLQMEQIARDALGLTPPAVKKPAAPKAGTAAARKGKKPAPPPPAPEPPPLVDEQFRAFELAYCTEATMVLTARTDGPFAHQKFVTLIAQPDLYGDLMILLKNVTDGESLDDNPQMRLVDAVDALADNRGELLFELRGNTQRQFALYRVLRGRAEKIFTSGGEAYGAALSQ